MKILISGGGVAGMTLAYWLHRHGHTPVVVERAPHGRLGGYGFDFHGTGYDVAQRMGVIGRLESHQLPVEAVVYVNGAGKIIARLSTEFVRRIVRGPYLALMHTGLEGVLIDAVQDDVEIRYNQSISVVRQDADKVDVTFADGTRENFELLIGADGIHSNTRELVFGPEERFARYLGCYLASHPVPDHYDVGNVRAHYNEPGRQIVTYPTDTPGERIALYLFQSPDRGHIPRAERLGLLRTTFGGMGWITRRLLADAPASEDIFVDTMTQIEMPHWHRGRVALVGDACGAMTLVSAQGVSMAMGGAYLLAEALRTHHDHGSAFAHYQRRMWREIQLRQRNARRFARILVPGTAAGVAAANLGMKLVLTEACTPILRRQLTSGSLLTKN